MLSLLDIDDSCTPGKEDRTEKLKKAFASPKARNKKIYLPGGDFHISGNILNCVPGNKVSLSGEMTRFVLDKDCSEPIVSIIGKEVYTVPFAGMLSWLTFDDIIWDGGGHIAQWFDIQFAAHLYFERNVFMNTNGTAIVGLQWWDSNFHTCSFASLKRGIYLKPRVSNAKPSWCNNETFETCRFESISEVAVELGALAIKQRFIGCKFDSNKLCIKTDGGKPNSAIGCQWTKCDEFVNKQTTKTKWIEVGTIADPGD